MKNLIVLIILFFHFQLIPIKLSATRYYINDNSLANDIFCTAVGNNTNNGLTPGTPKLTLKNLWTTYGPSGSNILTNGDSIFIDYGTYNTTGVSNVTEGIFNITVPGLTFIGAGIGKTIFDHNYYGSGSDYFMWIKANNTTVKNMTVQKYYGSPASSGVAVSGVNTGAQAITIDNATNILIENIQTSNNGGNGNASITVGPNSTVTISGGGSTCNATGSNYSGGIDVFGANITLNINNYVGAFNSKSAFFGSALYVFGNNSTTKVNVTNTRITGNIGKEGTALYLDGGHVSFRNCILENNVSTGGNYGGAIVVYNGTLKLSICKINNNSGTKGGGIAVYPNNGSVNLTIDSCLFSGNTVTSRGIDLYCRPKSTTNIFTVQCNQTTFSSSGNVITLEGSNDCTGSSVTLNYCGNPTVQNLSTNCVNPVFTNTFFTTYTCNPSPASYAGTDCSSINLPVELAVFDGKYENGNVELFWQTLSESNNDYFVVEKSTDGLSFQQIGKVNGMGYSNALETYSFVDADIFEKGYYYRLSQVDFDGKRTDFNIIYVDASAMLKNDFFQISYNVANSEIDVHFYSANEAASIINITNLFGQIVYQQNILMSEGININRIHKNLSENSFYILNLYSNGKIYSKKIEWVK